MEPLPSLNPCCEDQENLKEIKRSPVTYPNGDDAGTLVVYECQVCGRKHYIHNVNPILVGVTTS